MRRDAEWFLGVGGCKFPVFKEHPKERKRSRTKHFYLLHVGNHYQFDHDFFISDAPVDFSRTSNGSVSNDCKINVYGGFDSSGEKFSDNENAGVANLFGTKEGDLKTVEKCKIRLNSDGDVIQKLKPSDVVASKFYYGTFLDVETGKEKESHLLYENGMRGCSDSDNEDEIDIVGTQC